MCPIADLRLSKTIKDQKMFMIAKNSEINLRNILLHHSLSTVMA